MLHIIAEGGIRTNFSLYKYFLQALYKENLLQALYKENLLQAHYIEAEKMRGRPLGAVGKYR